MCFHREFYGDLVPAQFHPHYVWKLMVLRAQNQSCTVADHAESSDEIRWRQNWRLRNGNVVLYEQQQRRRRFRRLLQTSCRTAAAAAATTASSDDCGRSGSSESAAASGTDSAERQRPKAAFVVLWTASVRRRRRRWRRVRASQEDVQLPLPTASTDRHRHAWPITAAAASRRTRATDRHRLPPTRFDPTASSPDKIPLWYYVFYRQKIIKPRAICWMRFTLLVSRLRRGER